MGVAVAAGSCNWTAHLQPQATAPSATWPARTRCRPATPSPQPIPSSFPSSWCAAQFSDATACSFSLSVARLNDQHSCCSMAAAWLSVTPKYMPWHGLVCPVHVHHARLAKPALSWAAWLLQASGQAGDGQKGSICALSQNETAPSDCSSPFWCRQAEVPPLHGSGYGWCTDEAKPAVNPALGTAAMSSSVRPNPKRTHDCAWLLVTHRAQEEYNHLQQQYPFAPACERNACPQSLCCACRERRLRPPMQ